MGRVSAFFCALAIGAGFCARAESRWDYETLVGRMQSKHLTTFDQVLDEVPPSYWSHYVLLHDSRSSQPATADSPRVILAGADAHFIMAFNGEPGFPGYETLEMIQYRDADRRFEFREIRFPSAENQLKEPKVSGPNPKACLSCHGQDPRPNWEEYSDWPGTYGSSDDTLSEIDKGNYSRFLSHSEVSARYRRLARPAGSHVSPYSEVQFGDFDFRPNLFFTKLVARRNARRIAHKLLAQVQGKDRLVIPAVFLVCSTISSTAEARIARVLGMPEAEVHRNLENALGGDLFKKLMHKLGITPADWSLSFVSHLAAERPSDDDNYRYFDGAFQMDELVEFALLDELASAYPQLKPIAREKEYPTYDSRAPRPRAVEMLQAVNSLGGALLTEPSQACHVLAPLLD